MTRTAYRVIGVIVWRALRWYVRDRLRPYRKLAARTAVAMAALGVAAGLARRAIR